LPSEDYQSPSARSGDLSGNDNFPSTLVVQQIVKGELKGEAHFDWDAQGLLCTLILEL
jgi:hypothetical protein